MPPSKVGILVPAGMLGAGFDPATVERGLTLNPHVIAVHGGSTDSGPHYLGTGTARTTAAAVARDLRILLDAAARAGIPLVIGSCGTSGTDSGVDRVAGTAEEILPETGLDPRIARICSEQDPSFLEEQLAAGRVRPLPPVGPLDVSDAVHTALDERRVRVEGSRFEPAHPHTIKLEGARVTGDGTVSFAGIRDPYIAVHIDRWAAMLRTILAGCVAQTLGLCEDDYALGVRLYGHNAILGDIEPDSGRPSRTGPGARDEKTALHTL
jgi:hypothetical protein